MHTIAAFDSSQTYATAGVSATARVSRAERCAG